MDKDVYDTHSDWIWHVIPQSANRLKFRVRGYKPKDGSHLKRQYMHRIALNVTDSKIEIDHIDGNTLDNRRQNLRILDRSNNQINRGCNKNNKSGYKGVYTDSRRKQRWVAQIQINWKMCKLGEYATAKEAALAYDRKAYEQYGHYAYLNFPEELDSCRLRECGITG